MSLLIHPSMVFVSRLPKALFSEPSKLLLSPNTMSDDSDDPSFTLELVCKRKSYKSGTTVTQCSVKKCTKSSCVSCYREMLSKHGLSPLRDRKGEIVMCCSKAHYKIASKNAKLQNGCAKTSTPTAAAFGNQPPRPLHSAINVLVLMLLVLHRRKRKKLRNQKTLINYHGTVTAQRVRLTQTTRRRFL